MNENQPRAPSDFYPELFGKAGSTIDGYVWTWKTDSFTLEVRRNVLGSWYWKVIPYQKHSKDYVDPQSAACALEEAIRDLRRDLEMLEEQGPRT